jgi:thiamine-phosphate pyrophosphorylase
MRGLYAIVDTKSLRARGIDPVAFARAIAAAKPAALQLRAKDTAPREFLALLRAISPICREAGVPFVANDRCDLASLTACRYVHIGQSDLSIERVRRIAPGLLVGRSTHTPEQLTTALEAAPDYVAYGPVFPTTSKDLPDPVVGLAGLREAFRLASSARVPLVAIGGITLERAPDVAPFADAAAVISGLFPDARAGESMDALLDAVTERAREFQAVLSFTPPGEAPRSARATA